MITYKLHLIRHGQTEGNQKGLFVGRTDMPVSEEGFDELSRLRDTYESVSYTHLTLPTMRNV